MSLPAIFVSHSTKFDMNSNAWCMHGYYWGNKYSIHQNTSIQSNPYHPIEGLLYNFYITTTWYPSKCKKGLFPRWGSNSQPRHILTHTVYKYRALTDCATGEGGNFCPISWYSKLMFIFLVVMMVINQYKDIMKYWMVWIITSKWKLTFKVPNVKY